MTLQDTKLIFVYNAESGLLEVIKDGLHKMFKPSTYSCNLCAVTYGNFTMKNDWKNFIENLTISTEFLHKDEFQAKYPEQKDSGFPSAFYESAKSINLFISCDEMNKIKKLDQLIEIVKLKLSIIEKKAVIQPLQD